jgi:photosystem II stability/assembly factor-like uncharacterized protein
MEDDMSKETEIGDIAYSLAASPGFPQDRVCFAARSSGLYRSDDGGITWHPTYDSLDLEAPLATTAVVVSPAFESDRSVFAGVHGGILRSIDNGKSWHAATLPSPPPLVSTLATSPDFTHDGTLFAGTMEDGVFRSADRGSHWSAWNFGLLDLSILCMALSPDFANDETLFVGTESGVFRSTNGGRAWREVSFPTNFAPVLSLALSPEYTGDGVLFAGTESYGPFRSDDRGHTWEHLGEDIAPDIVNGIVLSPEFPTKPHVLVASSTALLISCDGGRSWSDWKTGQIFEEGIASVVAPQGLEPGALLLVGLVGGSVLRV